MELNVALVSTILHNFGSVMRLVSINSNFVSVCSHKNVLYTSTTWFVKWKMS